MFYPKRINFAKISSGFKDVLDSVNGYIKGAVYTNDLVIYEKRNGKDVMIYRDDEGEHVVYQKCPHAGCKIIFNKVEKTWDCPCHGSRFDLDGKCISGPANHDISVSFD